MISWEDTGLPRPNVDFGGRVSATVARTKMDSGRIRQRVRATRATRSLRVTWDFSDADFATFQALFREDLTNGADWFLMSLPFGGGVTLYQVRFTDQGYEGKYVPHLHYLVTATLDCLDQLPGEVPDSGREFSGAFSSAFR